MKQAIEHVLKGKRNGMRVPAIIAAGLPLATSLKGKTPGQTFYSVLYAESKKADGLVVQVARDVQAEPEAGPIEHEGGGVTFEVTLDSASATVDNLHDALTVAAELVAEARARLVITCDGEYDEGATARGSARCARVRAQPPRRPREGARSSGAPSAVSAREGQP